MENSLLESAAAKTVTLAPSIGWPSGFASVPSIWSLRPYLTRALDTRIRTLRRTARRRFPRPTTRRTRLDADDAGAQAGGYADRQANGCPSAIGAGAGRGLVAGPVRSAGPEVVGPRAHALVVDVRDQPSRFEPGVQLVPRPAATQAHLDLSSREAGVRVGGADRDRQRVGGIWRKEGQPRGRGVEPEVRPGPMPGPGYGFRPRPRARARGCCRRAARPRSPLSCSMLRPAWLPSLHSRAAEQSR